MAANLAIQIFNGLVQGSFYALMSLGLAVIFGVLRVVNFAHGAFFMLGAFGAYILRQQYGVDFAPALVVAPLAVAILGMLLERAFIGRLYKLDPLYNFLLTFGLALIIQDAMRLRFGMQGQPYGTPGWLAGAANLGVTFYPIYRLFVIVFSVAVCLAVWYLLERTRVGMVVRAATERPDLTRALGVNVDRWVTPVFGFGVFLAGLAGVMAAPMQSVSPVMGADLVITVFAVVVIGGLGSILGAVVAGFLVGVITAVGSVFFPPLANTLVFVLMAVVLLVRPAGLFGSVEGSVNDRVLRLVGFAVALVIALALPHVVYPILALDILLWGLLAVSLDLLLGYGGLLSFGHAMFWGTAGYAAGIIARGIALDYAFAALFGAGVAILLAIPIGYLTVRRRGIYFAMVTLAFAEMIFYVVNEARPITGGENGLQGVTRTWLGSSIADATAFYYYALPLVLLGYWVAYRVVHSPFGHVLVAIRDNEARAQSLGYPTSRYKLLAFVISAGLAGLAGGLNVLNHGFAALDLVHWSTSGQAVLMLILGGIGTLWGSIVGAALVLLLRDFLSTSTTYGDASGVVTGAVFVVIVLAFRRGIWGTLLHALHRRQPLGGAVEEAARAASGGPLPRAMEPLHGEEEPPPLRGRGAEGRGPAA